MKNLSCSIVIFLLAAIRAFAWSAEGHRTVAEIAYPLLTPATKAKVDLLLQQDSNHGTIADAATWPDDIKPFEGHLTHTPEAQQFNQAHPDNKHWHYVNFPVGAPSYDSASPFATPDDIVHIIQGCIDVLEGKPFQGLSKLDALRYIIHLTGDIHQPLHTITGYFNVASDGSATLVSAKTAVPATATNDQGGNLLHFTGLHHQVKGAAATELHALFDKELVANLTGDMVSENLAPKLLVGVTVNSFKTPGTAYRSWAVAWASASMQLATSAYGRLSFGDATLDSAHGDTVKNIEVSIPADFVSTEQAVVSAQLQKGGVHLAQLLNAIHWAN
jgi:hypothetical protein